MRIFKKKFISVPVIGLRIDPPKNIKAINKKGPIFSSCSHCKASLFGSSPVTTLKPSKGAIGIRLKIPKIKVKNRANCM